MAVVLSTTHYRFGVNSGTESTHGWHAAEDANPAQGVIAKDTTFLLRFTVQESGGTIASNTDQQFQCRKNAGAFQDITTSSTIVKAVTTAVFANAADLTKRLSGTGTFEASGDGGTHDGLSGGVQNDIAASGNSETECALQIVGADVATGDVIEFKLTSPDFTITNNVVPTLTVGATVSEADGASTGTGTPACLAVTIFAGLLSAAGVAASSVVAVAFLLTAGLASGAATDSTVSASVLPTHAASTGIASPLSESLTIAVGDGASVGSAAASSDGEAVSTGADGQVDGTATASAVAGEIHTRAGAASSIADSTVTGASLVQATGASGGIASEAIASASLHEASASSVGGATTEGTGLVFAQADASCVGLATVFGLTDGTNVSYRPRRKARYRRGQSR